MNKERVKLGLFFNVRIDNILIKVVKICFNELVVVKRILYKRFNKIEYWIVFEKVDKNLLDKYFFENILKVSIFNEV